MVHVPQQAFLAPAMGESPSGPQLNTSGFAPSRVQAATFMKFGPPGLELPVQAAAWGQPMKVMPKSMDATFSFPPGLALDEEVFDPIRPMNDPQGRAVSGCFESDGNASQASGDAGELRSSPANSTDTSGLLMVSNAIADLQELLQTADHCRRFRCPPGASVLQWSFTMQRKDSRVLHRAVAAFLHDGVPMHVAGPRCYSKKTARQCTAEMALALVRRKDVGLMEDGCSYIDLGDVLPCGGKGVKPGYAHMEQLWRFCSERFGTDASELEMQFNPDGSATLQFSVMGVLNTFHGPIRQTEEAAFGELARRAMWYLSAPTLQGCFQPDGQRLLAANCKVPAAPKEWTESLTSTSTAA